MRCQSPLARPPKVMLGRELAGRRTATRATKTNRVNVQLAWRGTVCQASLRDLSLSGVSLIVPVALSNDQVLRIFDPDFEALVSVVNSRPDDARFVIHAKVLTMLPKRMAGVFIKTAA